MLEFGARAAALRRLLMASEFLPRSAKTEPSAMFASTDEGSNFSALRDAFSASLRLM